MVDTEVKEKKNTLIKTKGFIILPKTWTTCEVE